jgi:CMP-N,N'-diacetyllegionaminic acid synthase
MTPTNVIGIIPVRGGSEGVPRKNIKALCGRPLFAYTIEACSKANFLSEFFVSTDDPEIAEIALQLGVQTLLHPRELSTGNAATIGVIRWDRKALIERRKVFSHLAIMRATSPFRTHDDIDSAIRLLSKKTEADSLVSVVATDGQHPIRLKRVDEDGFLVDAYESEGFSPKRRQELEPLFIRNGAIYIAAQEVIDKRGLWGTKCLPFIMPAERSLNINTQFDFLLAELLMAHQSIKNSR